MKYKSEIGRGVIHLWDLPDDKIYLHLRNPIKNNLLETAKKLAGGSWAKLARKNGINIGKHRQPEAIRAIRRGNKAKLWVIKRLSNFLIFHGYDNYSLKNLEKNISLIQRGYGGSKAILNPRFPFNFNTVPGAIFISSILHDGGIGKKYNEPFYSNTHEEMRKRVLNATIKIFGKLNSKQDLNKVRITFPSILGEILNCLKIKSGDKTITNVKIPSFFLRYFNKRIASEFIAQAVADDGSVYINKYGAEIQLELYNSTTKLSESLRKEIKQMGLVRYAPNLLKGDKKLLYMLDINSNGPLFDKECRSLKNRKKHITFAWRIRITNMKEIINFYRNIKIPLEYKQEKLEKIIEKLKSSLPLRYCILETINHVTKENKLSTIFILSNRVNKEYSTIRKSLERLVKNELVKKKKIIGAKRGDSKFNYVPKEKGKEINSIL